LGFVTEAFTGRENFIRGFGPSIRLRFSLWRSMKANGKAAVVALAERRKNSRM
jgi:hypothetical protein